MHSSSSRSSASFACSAWNGERLGCGEPRFVKGDDACSRRRHKGVEMQLTSPSSWRCGRRATGSAAPAAANHGLAAELVAFLGRAHIGYHRVVVVGELAARRHRQRRRHASWDKPLCILPAAAAAGWERLLQGPTKQALPLRWADFG